MDNQIKIWRTGRKEGQGTELCYVGKLAGLPYNIPRVGESECTVLHKSLVIGNFTSPLVSFFSFRPRIQLDIRSKSAKKSVNHRFPYVRLSTTPSFSIQIRRPVWTILHLEENSAEDRRTFEDRRTYMWLILYIDHAKCWLTKRFAKSVDFILQRCGQPLWTFFQ